MKSLINLELDDELKSFESPEHRLEFLRQKYLEIKNSSDAEDSQAIKAIRIYRREILEKIKSEVSLRVISYVNSYEKWVKEQLNVSINTTREYRKLYTYVYDKFGNPQIFSQNPNLSIKIFYKLAEKQYRDATSLHKEVVSRVLNGEALKEKDFNRLVAKWQEKQNIIKRLDTEIECLNSEGYYNSKNTEEAQKRIIRSIAQRRGQLKFREDLLKAYESKCTITGCDAQEALEAAHIIPYSETENNDLSNGLLLRADLHTLFDLNLIAIDPHTDPDERKVRIAPTLRNTQYEQLEGTPLRKPNNEAYLPKKEFLEERCNQCWWYR